MSALSRYKNFLRIIESWPLDKSKTNRDLGELIRKKVSDGFKASGELKHANDSSNCDSQLDALERLVKDVHLKSYPRSKNTCATGLTLEECNILVSNEGAQVLSESDVTFMDKLKGAFKKK
ncbi:unnamed protein product [Dimorphilus gyrociliatus]|uniref:Mitochondrial nucleoid factor 1 n=1 Tax=Dimorphilus gyrociliatus TaxID=2664684 RepID=A0A7I8V815_9ANNE|nr:unnamed protein product [Dimorphilus gyrociliatus]